MLGAAEVGKTLLTNQFMSSCDVGSYSELTGNSGPSEEEEGDEMTRKEEKLGF